MGICRGVIKVRSELKQFNRRKVNVCGYLEDVRHSKRRRHKGNQHGCVKITVTDVTINGIAIDHVNIEVGISFYERLKELQGKRIQFVGTVYKYVKHARGRKGRIKGFYKEDYSVTLDKKLQKEEK